MKITQLQNTYRDTQNRINKLRTPKKKTMKGSKSRARGPGRPKKKKFPNPKSKMGRPRKQVPVQDLPAYLEQADEASLQDSDAPPVLEPQGPQVEDEDEYSSAGGGGGSLLKPPRLTASSPTAEKDGANTSLSTLTSKFMKGKANPFANLLSHLAAGPSSAAEAVDEMEKFSDESGSDPCSETSSFKFGKTSKLSYCLEAYHHNKKRKADKPKKNSGGNSETIVPKKPKNLFMMLDFQRGFGVKTAEDEYTFEDSEDEDKEGNIEDSPQPSASPSVPVFNRRWAGEDKVSFITLRNSFHLMEDAGKSIMWFVFKSVLWFVFKSFFS